MVLSMVSPNVRAMEDSLTSIPSYQNFIWFINCLSVPSKLILSKGELDFQYILLGYKADLVNKVVRIYAIIVLGYNKIFPKTRTFSKTVLESLNGSIWAGMRTLSLVHYVHPSM